MSKTQEKAKAREDKILEFMKREIDSKGYAPSVREICEATGIKSTSTVHKDIKSLVSKGILKKDPSKPRALVLVEKTSRSDFSDISNLIPTSGYGIVDVPVVGTVAAGQPILADENIEDTFPFPERFIQGTNFMLRVKGDSMINVGIFDGDFILVEKRDIARRGEIVVAMVDGFESEATVKRYYPENGHIRLQPENDSMSPIIVDHAKILGKVKGVFRYYSN